MRAPAISILVCIVTAIFIYEVHAGGFIDFSLVSSPSTNDYVIGEREGWLVLMDSDLNEKSAFGSAWYNGLLLKENRTPTYDGGLTVVNTDTNRNAVHSADAYSMIFDIPSLYATAPFAEQDSGVENLSGMDALDTSLESNASGFYGTLQVIPEPVAFSLVVIFGGGLLFARRIFKKV